MTDAVIEGASHADISGIEVRLTQPLETGPAEVLDADAVILGTTENFGYMSGAMKDFFDRIYYPCLEKLNHCRLPCLFAPVMTASGRAAVSNE